MSVVDEIDAVLPHLPRNAQRDLLISGLELLRENGFHGTSTRAVAKSAGMSPAALYVHYPSKTALLFELAKAGHSAVLEAVRSAVAQASPNPRARILAFVESYTCWHAEHASLARVVQYEMGALVDPGRSEVLEIRRSIERMLKADIEAGVEQGEFAIDDLRTTRLALLSLGIDVARWFGTVPGPDPRTLGRSYALLADRLLGPPAT